MRRYAFTSALSYSFFVGEELAPPVAPNLSIPTTIVKGQNTLAPHNTPASLVKGEVLSPTKIRATTGGIATSPNPSKTALSHSLFVMLTSVYVF